MASLKAKLLRLHREAVKAAIEDSWKGSQPPEDHVKIEKDLKNAQNRFRNALGEALHEMKERGKKSV